MNQHIRPLPEPSTREQVVDRYARVRLHPDHAAIHEETIGAVYSSVLGSGDTAVDGGAHSGKHTLPMAQAVGPLGRVIACEPLDEARRQLERKLEAGAFDVVEVSPSALWDSAGETMEFLYFPQRPGVSGFRRRTDGGALVAERRIVTTTTVDALVGVGNVNFVKLDVEGAELLALRGAEQVVRRSRPTVHVEAGTVSWQAYNLDAGDLDAWCQEHGYACFDVVGTPVTSKESLSVSFGTAGVWDYILVDRASASWERVVLALNDAATRFGLDPTLVA